MVLPEEICSNMYDVQKHQAREKCLTTEVLKLHFIVMLVSKIVVSGHSFICQMSVLKA